MQSLLIIHFIITLGLCIAVYALYQRISVTTKYIIESKQLIEKSIEHNVPVDTQMNIEQWLALANSEKENQAKTMEILESAINKYPFSKELVERYVDVTNSFMRIIDNSRKKALLERQNRVARVYIDNCSANEWSQANDLLSKILREGNVFMQDKLQEITVEHKELITKMEGLLDMSCLSDVQVKELEELDRKLDKNLIDRNSELRKRYQEITNNIIKLMGKTDSDKQKKIKEYNYKALDHIKMAYQKFEGNKKMYSKGLELQGLANLLGGWDANILLPSTQLYFTSVYSEIFGALKHDGQIKMTDLMIRQQTREME